MMLVFALSAVAVRNRNFKFERPQRLISEKIWFACAANGADKLQIQRRSS
jgi:hypothetical protein